VSRSPDVMDLIAKARPARLDAPPDRGGHTAQAIVDIMATAPATEGLAALGRIRRPRPLRVAFLGTVGAVAAAAVVMAVAGPSAAPRDAPDAASDVASPTSDAPLDYKRLLLVAAERSEKAPQASGRYLTMQQESGYAVPVDAAEGRYVMFEKIGGQYWLARSSADSSWAFSQPLGAAPATPTDEGRWRRDGSPAVMKVTKPKPHDLKIASGAVEGWKIDPAHYFALGDRNVSQAQFDALPTDPAALRDALLSRFYDGGNADPGTVNEWLFGTAGRLVIDLPVSKEVRAAAYRMLATMPGVRGLGVVQDTRGRRGQAVAFAGHGLEERLIIDPDTGRALAREIRVVEPGGGYSWMAPGALYTYDLVLVSGSTNDSPPAVDAKN
jgi:hypothetical protein